MRSLIACVLMALPCAAQGAYSCPDDSSTALPFYTNTGSVDHHVDMAPSDGSDKIFKVKVYNQQNELVGTIVFTEQVEPIVTVPPGGYVTLEDPVDANELDVEGTYTVS